MPNQYANLLEKIERQNSYSLKDKLEARYELNSAAAAITSGIKTSHKYLKIIIALQLANLGYQNSASLINLIKIIL